MVTQRGMSTGLIVTVIAIGLLLVGGYYVMMKKDGGNAMMKEDGAMMMEKDGDAMMEKDDAMMMEDGTMMKGDDHMMEGDHMMEKDDAMMKKDGDSMMKKDDAMMDSGAMGEPTPIAFTGKKIAGNASPLLEFNESDYAKAIASDKLVVLYFYASWCPSCKAEFPKMEAAFNQLSRSNVVGFRVHFNDNETTDAMTALAREFGVPYQHTKVFIHNGERVLKSPETWTTERYISEITKVVN